jgi:hypothetical protein
LILRATIGRQLPRSKTFDIKPPLGLGPTARIEKAAICAGNGV